MTYTLFSGSSFGSIDEYASNRQIWFRNSEFKKNLLYFHKTQIFLHQLLVVGSLFQIASCLVQFLQLSFPLFVLSFGIGGIGMSFQVRITKPLIGIATDNTIFPS